MDLVDNKTLGPTARIDVLGLLSEDELAVLIDVKKHTLTQWRADGKGPDFTKLGKSVFYRRVDVENWIAANVVVTKRIS